MLTLQDLEDDSLQFDLSAESLEELFEWYQAAWNITQSKISHEYNRQHEVSARDVPAEHTLSKHAWGLSGVGLHHTGK